jgi:4-amino-4-deoxy-L-arabinose transferase
MIAAQQSSLEFRVWLPLGIALVGIFLVYPLCLNLPLIDPDEGLHAAIAQEMVERGDWITPRLLGEPFLDKPILFTWCQAASLKLFGSSAAAVRLPGMLFGLLGIVTTGLLGARLFAPSVGVLGGAMYAITVLPIALTQVAVHDVALVPWVNLAILLLWEADRGATARRIAMLTLAAGALLGLACLTKGLLGIVFVGLAYGSCLLVARRLTAAHLFRGTAVLATAAAVAALWFLAMERQNAGYLHYYFVERHLFGFATDSQRHSGEPWWYYVPILLAGGLPWTPYLPALAIDRWARRTQVDAAAAGSRNALTLMVCWLVACTVFLSLASSKLITYSWPLFPPLAILAAVVWHRLLDGSLAPVARRYVATVLWLLSLAGPVLLPLALGIAQAVLEVQFSWVCWVLAAAAGAGCLVPLVFWRRGRRQTALALGIASLAPQFAVLLAVVGPPAAAVNSATDLAAYFNGSARLPKQVVVIEDRVGSLVFYLRPELRRTLQPDQITTVRPHKLAGLGLLPPETVFVLADWNVEHASRYVGLNGRGFRRTGRYRLYAPREIGLPVYMAADGRPLGIR